MAKVILIYANCVNDTAKGDFALAGALAKDLAHELTLQKSPISVVLTSTVEGLWKYQSLYGKSKEGKISIEGIDIEVAALEFFDTTHNEVVAFIEANRCKYAPVELVKRVLSLDSKMLFVGAANQPSFNKLSYMNMVNGEQSGLLSFFDDKDIYVLNSGLGKSRFGIPKIKDSSELKELSIDEKKKIPNGNFGFIYLASISPLDEGRTIGQYMQLTQYPHYVLVGNLDPGSFLFNLGMQMESDELKSMTCHQSLDNLTMRHMVASALPFVISTGVMSTLEAMSEGKFPFYQYMNNNEHFVLSYLTAVHSLCTSQDSKNSCTSDLIFKFATVLFAPKPLEFSKLNELKKMMASKEAVHDLTRINKTIVAEANGKIAGRLLAFLGEPTRSTGSKQCLKVLRVLRKNDEQSNPDLDQALRRAAAWGKELELKIILNHIKTIDIDKKDSLKLQRGAIHWAVIGCHFSCAEILLAAGAEVNLQDAAGKTPLFYAVKANNREMIKLLIVHGASVNVKDNEGNTPCANISIELHGFIQTCLHPSLSEEHAFKIH